MKAIVYTADHTLEWREVPEPPVRPGEVLIKVSSVGICGSELSALQEPTPYRRPPLIMGHEFAGVLVGSDERVTVNPLIACGVCAQCRVDRSHLCAERRLVGVHMAGAFAEYVSAPTSSVVKLPEGMPLKHAALAEPMATVLHFMSDIDLSRVSRMGIIGMGGIGMLALLAARAQGIEHVEVAELQPERCTRASAYGAADVGSRLEGKFDVTLDAVGTSGTRAASVSHLARGGRAVWVGLHDDESTLADVRDLIRREASIATSFAYTMSDFQGAVRLLAGLQIDDVVEEVPFASGLSAFSRLLAGKVAAPKVHLVM